MSISPTQWSDEKSLYLSQLLFEIIFISSQSVPLSMVCDLWYVVYGVWCM